MEKKALDLIVRDGQKLAEKRSWLEKGYQDLLTAINAELVKIPDMPESEIDFEIKKWSSETHHGDKQINSLVISLIFTGDAFIRMDRNWTDVYSGDKNYEIINRPSISKIRLFASKIGEAMVYFLEEINRRNDENQKAIDTIGGILRKLAS